MGSVSIPLRYIRHLSLLNLSALMERVSIPLRYIRHYGQKHNEAEILRVSIPLRYIRHLAGTIKDHIINNCLYSS